MDSFEIELHITRLELLMARYISLAIQRIVSGVFKPLFLEVQIQHDIAATLNLPAASCRVSVLIKPLYSPSP